MFCFVFNSFPPLHSFFFRQKRLNEKGIILSIGEGGQGGEVLFLRSPALLPPCSRLLLIPALAHLRLRPARIGGGSLRLLVGCSVGHDDTVKHALQRFSSKKAVNYK